MAVLLPAQTFPRERLRRTKRHSTTTSNVPSELPAPSSERGERCFWLSFWYFGKAEATVRNRTLWQQIGLKKKWSKKKFIKRLFWLFNFYTTKVTSVVSVKRLTQVEASFVNQIRQSSKFIGKQKLELNCSKKCKLHKCSFSNVEQII